MANQSVGDVLPAVETLKASRARLMRALPEMGVGLANTTQHLQQDIVPSLSRSSQSPHYYGFVTGGATQAAAFADSLVTQYDQNVAVHLPNDSIATDVEDAALRMLLDLFDLPEKEWQHRTFTTGATASNILGLTCGREFVVQAHARRSGKQASVAEMGVFEAMRTAELDRIKILSTLPHSSLKKAASVAGLGRDCLKEVCQHDAPIRFDLEALENGLREQRTATIVAVSCAEINTGFFATSREDILAIRALCDKYGAWLHVDAAFGLQARCLSSNSSAYARIVEGVGGLEFADSITGDAHKLLNVPYECGIFLSRHLDIGKGVFQNPGAAYLRTDSNDIPSPLNIGLENSRRFRALPVYATLASHGRDGYRDILTRQIDLARAIARLLLKHQEYELLPKVTGSTVEAIVENIYIIVIFRAKDETLNRELTQRINATRKVYVSGTQWEGGPATRFAVSNWQVDVQRDIAVIEEVLESVLM